MLAKRTPSPNSRFQFFPQLAQGMLLVEVCIFGTFNRHINPAKARYDAQFSGFCWTDYTFIMPLIRAADRTAYYVPTLYLSFVKLVASDRKQFAAVQIRDRDLTCYTAGKPELGKVADLEYLVARLQ